MQPKITRRQVLAGAALAAATGAARAFGQETPALSRAVVGPRAHQTGGDTLVVLFLRGGADGLNIVAPYADEDYYRLRPTLALPKPGDRTAAPSARLLDLDGFFGLHPVLAPLLPHYREGRLAALHAIGSGDQTRSHFEAMATMERGLAQQSGAASGWLARHLASTATPADSPLRAVAFADTLPDSLRGAPGAAVLETLADFRLTPPAVPLGSGGRAYHAPPDSRAPAVLESLRAMYSTDRSTDDALSAAGQETLDALEAVRRLDPARYRPAPGVVYPPGEPGQALRQVACMVKGEIGLEVACLDMNGWDTHVAQGRDTGWQPARLADLGRGLAAFAADLGARMVEVTVVVMTEFGRRAYENSGLGTDHGRGSCLLALGGGVNGGRVYADWPGLAREKLEEPGDLRVTTDYRDALAEVVARRLKNPDLAAVFPGCAPRPLNLVRPA